MAATVATDGEDRVSGADSREDSDRAMGTVALDTTMDNTSRGVTYFTLMTIYYVRKYSNHFC